MRYPEVTLAIILILAITGIGYWTITGYVLKAPSGLDSFAQCLTDSGAVMYGAYWCPHCQRQELLFGSSWHLINYVECDPRGNFAQPGRCAEQGVTGYPTWTIKGQRLTGEQSLQVLAQASGCSLPS